MVHKFVNVHADFPQEFPQDGLTQVITWVKGGNRDRAGARATIEGGWELAGYAIGQGFDSPQMAQGGENPQAIPADWQNQLEQIRPMSGADTSGTGIASKLPPWLLPLLLQILQQVVTHLSSAA